MRKKGRREVNQREETEQGATGAERGQDKGGTGKGRKKGARQEEGGRERKREQEKGAGQKGEKQVCLETNSPSMKGHLGIFIKCDFLSNTLNDHLKPYKGPGSKL